jgi:hypothetical protein
VKATRGKVHDYLGMAFTYGEDGVAVDMRNYIRTMMFSFCFLDIEIGTPIPYSVDCKRSIHIPFNNVEVIHQQKQNVFLCPIQILQQSH